MSRPTSRAPPADAGAADETAQLLVRIRALIERKLDQMEIIMIAGDMPNSADLERETRAIGALITNLDKVRDLETERTRAAAGGDPKSARGVYSGEDADRRRRALAQRIERLRERARSLGPDGGDG